MPVAYGNIFSGPGSLFMYPENHFLSNENLFSVQAETIMALAQKGSGIFVGRCSDFIPGSIRIAFYFHHRGQEYTNAEGEVQAIAIHR